MAARPGGLGPDGDADASPGYPVPNELFCDRSLGALSTMVRAMPRCSSHSAKLSTVSPTYEDPEVLALDDTNTQDSSVESMHVIYCNSEVGGRNKGSPGRDRSRTYTQVYH